jgi:hypothetical protein
LLIFNFALPRRQKDNASLGLNRMASLIAKGERVAWIQPNGFGEIGDGAVVVTFIAIGDAAAEKGECVFLIESNGLVEIGDSPVGVAFFVIS